VARPAKQDRAAEGQVRGWVFGLVVIGVSSLWTPIVDLALVAAKL